MTVENEGGIRVIRVCMPPIPHRGFHRRLLMYLSFCVTSLFGLPLVRKPDVIWVASPSVFSSFPAAVYRVLKRAPLVRNVDDLWPETALQLGVLSSRFRKVGEYLARLSYIMGNALTPISKAYTRTLVEKYSIRPEDIKVVEVGVDTGLFRPAGRVESSPFSVVYSGLLGVAYDFDCLLEAASALREEEVDFLIRGVGEMEGSIRRRISEGSLHNVTVSTQFLQIEGLVSLLNSAGSLILPMSKNESQDAGIPTKLLEYMSCGRPILCVSSGASAEIVRNAACGVVVPPGDSSALADAIRTLRASEEREQMGINARAYAEANFSLWSIAKKLEEAFHHAGAS